jgi:hypothetical protein
MAVNTHITAIIQPILKIKEAQLAWSARGRTQQRMNGKEVVIYNMKTETRINITAAELVTRAEIYQGSPWQRDSASRSSVIHDSLRMWPLILGHNRAMIYSVAVNSPLPLNFRSLLGAIKKKQGEDALSRRDRVTLLENHFL